MKFLQSILLISLDIVLPCGHLGQSHKSFCQLESTEAKLRACRGPNNDAMVIRSRSKQALTCVRVKIAQQTQRIWRQISFWASSKFGLSKLAFLRTFFSARMDWDEKPSLLGVHFSGISHPSRSISRAFDPDSSPWNSSFMLQNKKSTVKFRQPMWNGCIVFYLELCLRIAIRHRHPNAG